MANGVNKVILLGNLGKDPEVKHFEGGSVKVNFPLATSESHKDKNGNRVDQTEWHNVVLWRAQAEFAEKYLKKGYTIYVEGKLKTRNWEDQNNVKKYITEVVGDSITIISKNDKRDDASGAANAEVIEAPTGDDLPF
jgi:single-strand DNA-binding protein